jgi:hypothetical protein
LNSIGTPSGMVRWASMPNTTHRSTIDIAEPGREVERAAEMFARSEGGIFPPQAISNLRLAVELIMAIAPHSTRDQAERAVVDEFLMRTESKLADVVDAAAILRSARERLDQLFPVKK